MKLSVIIPCFNEENTISILIEKISKCSIESIEIIVVNDCSTDLTESVLNRIQNQYSNLKIYNHKKNQGKGAAIRTGVAKSTGDIILIQDADLEYDPSEYPKLILPILQDKADVVYGSRFIGGDSHRILYFWHRVGNAFLTVLSNIFTNLNLSDMETCYKVFRCEIIKKISIKENRFGFEPEITAKIARLNCRIYEVGISYYGRTYAEGKKIGWKDGFRAIYCIIRYNFFK
jgi:glycosyltransferase involved in cell wall biosynthesis